VMLSPQRSNKNAGPYRRFRVLALTLDTGEVLPTLVAASS
jgi:hypothetical protein